MDFVHGGTCIGDIEVDPPPINKRRLLCQLKEVSHLLHDASQQLNTTFTLSSTMCIINDFFEHVIHTYFNLEYGVLYDSSLANVGAVLESISRSNSFRILGNACEMATQQV